MMTISVLFITVVAIMVLISNASDFGVGNTMITNADIFINILPILYLEGCYNQTTACRRNLDNNSYYVDCNTDYCSNYIDLDRCSTVVNTTERKEYLVIYDEMCYSSLGVNGCAHFPRTNISICVPALWANVDGGNSNRLYIQAIPETDTCRTVCNVDFAIFDENYKKRCPCPTKDYCANVTSPRGRNRDLCANELMGSTKCMKVMQMTGTNAVSTLQTDIRRGEFMFVAVTTTKVVADNVSVPTIMSLSNTAFVYFEMTKLSMSVSAVVDVDHIASVFVLTSHNTSVVNDVFTITIPRSIRVNCQSRMEIPMKLKSEF